MFWTNEANYATEMNPSRIELRNWEEDLGISPSVAETPVSGAVPVHENKYLDVRLSEMHGIPIYTRLRSGARRNVTPAGYVFGRHRHDLYKSPASSSSSYQQNGGAGGTRKSYPLPADSKGILSRTGKVLHNPCSPGYVPKRVKGKLMCVPLRSSKKSRSR